MQMKVESIFNEESSTTIQEIIQSIINEKIDTLIKGYYDQFKVNTATSHVEGKIVS